MTSNNPPDVVLELTHEQAQFLLSNCDQNIAVGLAGMQMLRDRDSLVKLVSLTEKFKEIRNLLRRQGVHNDP